jgi:hypothetical protein
LIELEQRLCEELEQRTPLPDRSLADWGDVLRRGGMASARKRSLRPTLLLAAALLALAVSVPALAFHDQLAQTIRQFLGSSDEPLNAKQLIEGVIRFPSGSGEQPYELTAIRRVISADTPAGEVRLYELIFSNGDKGSAIVGVDDRSAGGASWGPAMPCPRGWALQAGGSMIGGPGSTPLYLSGRASQQVNSLQVVYPDGHTTAAAVANGYFLAWVLPDEERRATRPSFVSPVELVARDRDDNEIGRLSVRGDGDIPLSPGQPAQAAACG